MTASSTDIIRFNVPNLVGAEADAINQALSNRVLHGDGAFTRLCHDWFNERLACKSAFLTQSCTLALELATLVAEIGPGDEVLVPDFTFVTTAQAVALRGATPVLCDIRSDTLNIDESRLEEALTEKTRAIIPVHYAGISAEMEQISAFARKHGLVVIEDAAQAIGCSYHGDPVGIHSDMAAFSFHATKNIHCGEGGMLAINNAHFSDAAAIAWEKGTDRRQFTEGRVEKYQWKALGSSYLASEITAAMLSVQLTQVEAVNSKRLEIWNRYHDTFAALEKRGIVKRPTVPAGIVHNGHIFYLVLPTNEIRSRMMKHMRKNNIEATFHYTPLHQSDGGQKYCRQGMTLDIAADLPHRLIRLPLYPDLSDKQQSRVIEVSLNFLDSL